MSKFCYFHTLFLIIVVTLFFFVDYKVSEYKNLLRSIYSELEIASEELHILKAEWAYFTNPERIEKIAEKLLGIKSDDIIESIVSLNNNTPYYKMQSFAFSEDEGEEKCIE